MNTPPAGISATRSTALRRRVAVAALIGCGGIIQPVAIKICAAQTLSLREVWATKGPDAAPFGFVAGMTELSDGRIVVADGGNDELIAVSPDGKSFQRIARKGRGPGEIRGPSFLTRTPNGFALYDIGQNAVQLWTDDARFLKAVPLDIVVVNPKGFLVLPNGEFLLSGGSPGHDHAIHRFNSNGQLARSWYALPATRDPAAAVYIAGGAISRTARGELLFSQAAPHRIIRFAANGQGRTLAADDRVIKPIGDRFIERVPGEIRYKWFFDQSRAIFELPNGMLLNVIRRKYTNASTWELFSATGKLLQRGNVGKPYEPFDLTRDGHVLAKNIDPTTDESIVVKLKLEIGNVATGVRK